MLERFLKHRDDTRRRSGSEPPSDSSLDNGPALADCEFAVVDLETTGLFAQAHDRVVEIGLVRLAGDGTVLDEYNTLVNPERDIGPTEIHGIWTSDVLSAPVFAQIAGDVAGRLRGAVVVGHNVRFELDFLTAEYLRAGHPLPALPALCTMRLSTQFARGAPGRRLGQCCAHAGIALDGAHTALADARAAGHLLVAYIERARARGLTTLPALGCNTQLPPPAAWPRLPPTGIARPRQAGPAAPTAEASYLSRLIERIAETDGTAPSEDTVDYLDVLDRALEDRRVTAAEADALAALAENWGIGRSQLHSLHKHYLESLVAAALADGVVSSAERRDLELVADLLGLERDALATALAEPPPLAPASATQQQNLRGQSVCFTGAMTCRLRGEPISRTHAEHLATEAGLIVTASVTKKLDLLVMADPDSLSGKARKARAYGTRIIAERAFWRALGVQVD